MTQFVVSSTFNTYWRWAAQLIDQTRANKKCGREMSFARPLERKIADLLGSFIFKRTRFIFVKILRVQLRK